MLYHILLYNFVQHYTLWRCNMLQRIVFEYTQSTTWYHTWSFCVALCSVTLSLVTLDLILFCITLRHIVFHSYIIRCCYVNVYIYIHVCMYLYVFDTFSCIMPILSFYIKFHHIIVSHILLYHIMLYCAVSHHNVLFLCYTIVYCIQVPCLISYRILEHIQIA